jgi:hypothetical protein
VIFFGGILGGDRKKSAGKSRKVSLVEAIIAPSGYSKLLS